MDPDRPREGASALETLIATLQTALHITRDLARDEILSRLVAAFADLPAEDRPVIVEVLEREVKARALSRATESTTGQSMVPNPHARLYVRAHDTVFDRNLLERGEMMNATIQAMRAASIIPGVPEIHASWREATREAMRHVDEPTRAVVEQLVLDVLDFLREARAADAGAEEPPPVAGTRERAGGS